MPVEALPSSVTELAGNTIVTSLPALDTVAAVAAVVNVVLLELTQFVATPVAFLGAIYQLYVVDAVKPLAL